MAEHKYTHGELFAMDLDELRLVALMVGVVFTEDTDYADLVVWILQKQNPWPWSGPGLCDPGG